MTASSPQDSMSRNFDTAAEFCDLAGTPDLLEYLQLDPSVDPSVVQETLKKKRKYMQGMQSNPKYRKQALFLIKHFKALSAALADPAAYQLDALRRAESVHLPILEMTVKGVLAGGGLTEDQESYLQRNATELGVSEATFDDLLNRLCSEAGVRRPSAADPRIATPATVPPIRRPGEDLFALLGVDSSATQQEIRTAYERNLAKARAQPKSASSEALIVRLDLAWSVLSDPRARATYQIAQTRTGPPARQREASSRPAPGGNADTLRFAHYSPPPTGSGSRLEVLSEPVRYVSIGSGVTTTRVRIRNGGSGSMGGRAASDQPWMTVAPEQFDPNVAEQDIVVSFHAGAMPGSTGTAALTITTDRGEQACVVFHASRSKALLYAGIGGVVLVAALALGGWALQSGDSPSELRVEVDPWAQKVTLDGAPIGEGSVITVPKVPRGEHEIEVEQTNFAPLKRKLTSHEIESGVVRVELQQTRRLNFNPGGSLRRTAIPQEEASRIFAQRSAAIDACIRRMVKPDRVLTGAIRVHIDRDGLAAGLETQGKHTDDPDVRRCLERQAAALRFSTLENGDYATVRYEYTVTASEGNGDR